MFRTFEASKQITGALCVCVCVSFYLFNSSTSLEREGRWIDCAHVNVNWWADKEKVDGCVWQFFLDADGS